jgi:hypothetical protein
VFPDAGWEISYLEPSTYQVNMSMRAFDAMVQRNPDKAEEIQLAALRFTLIEPTLANRRAHAPVGDARHPHRLMAGTDSLRCPSNLAVG